jgi:hypothetical protein
MNPPYVTSGINPPTMLPLHFGQLIVELFINIVNGS